ncbi:MAG: hypothetical protein J6S13_09065 [Clostridia bacterium]|nr:hypothetical protein [Clostridia bacterium]
MKKIITCLLALCLILSFAVACGDKKTDSNSTNGTNASSSDIISTVIGNSEASSTESTAAESEPTMSEIMNWWGNVSLEIE